ncbi:MAG: TonB-dependent receptor, partial [Bryobacter sp.]|nr:TonB-dependent receptor [Bryobacter sp.]
MAQTVTGTIEGHVVDATGGAIVNATIIMRGTETGLTRRTVTNGEGLYQFTFAPLAEYEIIAESAGFTTVRRKGEVRLNQTIQVDFNLKPSAVAAEITVTDEAPLIDTTRGELKSTIDSKTIEDRPLSSRNILSLVEQLPGFQSTGGFSGVNNPTLSSGSYVSFNGTGSRSAAFQIDGVNNDDSSEGSNRQNVNVSSIKEFQVLTNAYSAEFGRAGGAVVLVQTKSGTNNVHGDLYEFFQNEKLNTNTFFGNASGRKADGSMVAPRAPYRRNQFGGTVGLPIIRNKLFFFGSYEQTKLIQYTTVNRWIFLPTDKLQVGDCRTCLNPEQHPNLEADRKFLQSIMDRFPKVEPNNPLACPRCNTAFMRALYPDGDLSGKLDFNPSQRDTLAVRYQYSRQRRKPENFIEGENAWQNNKQQAIGTTWTHMFGALTWGEFRYGLGLRTTLVDISSGNDTPIVRITNPSIYTTTTMGSAGQFPILRYQTDHQFVYNLSFVRGRHIIKAGVDIRRQHLDDLADNYSRGWWTFGNIGLVGSPERYEGYENFFRGYVTGYERGYGNFTTFNRSGEFNQYVMDDFKLRKNLTLNFGLRWEVVLKPTEKDNKIDYVYSTFTKGLQPRFGFAWAPEAKDGWLRSLTGGAGKTSIRGGYGIFHNRIFQSVFSQGGLSVRSLPPYGVYKTFNATFNVADPSGGFVFDPSQPVGRIQIVRIDPGLTMPQVQQYHFTMERQLPGQIAVSVGYNGTRGIGMLQNSITNRACFPCVDPTTGIMYDKIDPNLSNTNPAPGFISLSQPRVNNRRPDPRYLAVYNITNSAWTYFNSLRLEVRKRYSKGLLWQIAYTFGRSIDTGSDVTAGNPITEYDGPISNRGLSDFHQQHRANFNWSYRLPWFAGQRGFRNLLV